MDPVRNFLWYLFHTLTICSMLLMLVSLYYGVFGDGNRGGGGVLSAIIVVFGLISYTYIIPNLAQIAAVAIPYVEANKYTSIRLLRIAVFMIGVVKYPFLVHLSCSSLMTGIGLWKIYGDNSPVFRRGVMTVIFRDTIEVIGLSGTFVRYYASCGVKYGTTGIALLGLALMAFATKYLPPLMKPEKKKKKKMAEAPVPGVEGGVVGGVEGRKKLWVDQYLLLRGWFQT